jgi:hypothetical protein
VRVEELQFVCEEAARDLAATEPRPLPAAVVLPAPQVTRLVKLPDFPDDDAGRAALLRSFARDEILAKHHPAYGFLAEAELDDGGDVLLVVCGAHSVPPRIAAAPLGQDRSVGEFTEPEPLAPRALPFLHPLQHAVEEVREAPTGIRPHDVE